MNTRNRPAAVAAIADFIRDNGIVNHSVHGIAKALNTRKGGFGWSFEQRDISEARRLVLAQPLTQPLISQKENTMETKKVVGLASGTKPLPIEVKPHTIALAPKLPAVIVPPPPVVQPPPACGEGGGRAAAALRALGQRRCVHDGEPLRGRRRARPPGGRRPRGHRRLPPGQGARHPAHRRRGGVSP